MWRAVKAPTVPSTAEPLSAAAFNAAMAPFAPFSPQGLAIAVSGGPDSMALALCAQQWASTHNLPLRAFIVDHALRMNSGEEAQETHKQLEKLGISAEILRWEHTVLTSRLHITARKARYKLLTEACKKQGINTLLLAHQREDQAETILMRFAKGSGIDGLAGIAAETKNGDIRLLRPLLAFAKEQLVATCEAAKISYVIDPSNNSEKFARGRLRRVMPLLAEEGLTQERLYDLGVRAADARDALDHYTNLFLQKSVEMDDAGTIRMDVVALRALPRAIAERAITSALQNICREDYAPEYASLMGLLNAVFDDPEMSPRTLHGCLVSMTSSQLLFMREYAAITDALMIGPGETVLWDGRWQVTLTADTPKMIYTIRPLGNPPHEVLDRLVPGLRQKISQGRARAGLPALWTPGKAPQTLALIPHLTRSSGSSQSYAQVLPLQLKSTLS